MYKTVSLYRLHKNKYSSYYILENNVEDVGSVYLEHMKANNAKFYTFKLCILSQFQKRNTIKLAIK